MELSEKEAKLEERLKHIEELEAEVRRREKELKARDSARKQIVLRLSPTLWNDIAAWAEEDFRSINGQIEYLLADAVKRRKNGKKDG